MSCLNCNIKIHDGYLYVLNYRYCSVECVLKHFTIQQLYQLYKNDILQNGNIILGGRLGLHKYLDMHQVINNSLAGVNRFLSSDKS